MILTGATGHGTAPSRDLAVGTRKPANCRLGKGLIPVNFVTGCSPDAEPGPARDGRPKRRQVSLVVMRTGHEVE